MNRAQIALLLVVFGLGACGKGSGSGSRAGGTGGAGTTSIADGGLAGSATGGSTGIGDASNPGGASGAGGVAGSAGSTIPGGSTAAGGSMTTGIGSGDAGLGGADAGGTGRGGTTVLGGSTGAGGTTGAGGVSRTGDSSVGGGTAGSIATGGASGTGGALPSCNRDAGLSNVQACGYLVASGNTILETNVTAEVTVKAVSDLLEGSPCPLTEKTRRVSLAADAGTWDLDFDVTGLPADFIRKGDVLGLTVASWRNGRSLGPPPVSQSVVVTRDGKTILITWTGTASAVSSRSPQSSSGAPAPVSIAGVSLANDGILCASTGGFCDGWRHRALITVGTSSATVEPSQTANVGGLQVVLESFADAVDTGFCDGFGRLTFAAFAP